MPGPTFRELVRELEADSDEEPSPRLEAEISAVEEAGEAFIETLATSEPLLSPSDIIDPNWGAPFEVSPGLSWPPQDWTTAESLQRVDLEDSQESHVVRRRIPAGQRIFDSGSSVGERIRARARATQEYTPTDGNEMSTIAQMFNLSPQRIAPVPHPLVEGIVGCGVEVELEGITEAMPESRLWSAIPDGSLRNRGREYVTQGPMGGESLYNSLSELDVHLSSLSPDASWRCSTHVHVDVRDLTGPQIRKFILAYTVHELLIFQCSGMHRYKNNFCMPLGFAQQLVQILSEGWSRPHQQFLTRSIERWNKYTAINLIPVSYQGSIEFRMSEAKWRKGHLLKLCNRFLALREAAVAHIGTEEEFLNSLMATDTTLLMRKGLPNGFIVNENQTARGYKLAMDILTTSKLREKSRSLVLMNLPSITFNRRTSPDELAHVNSRMSDQTAGWTLDWHGLNRARFVDEQGVSSLEVYFICSETGMPPGYLLSNRDRETYRTWSRDNAAALSMIISN